VVLPAQLVLLDLLAQQVLLEQQVHPEFRALQV
jgi:hypothetical protein